MDAVGFDRWTRLFSTATSRRASVTAVLLILVPLALSSADVAAITCKGPGDKCKRPSECCSDVCQKVGKKKKGKKPRKKCIGNGCQSGAHSLACGGSDVLCRTSIGNAGVCDTTTSDAPYCDSRPGFDGDNCKACTKNSECVVYCGPRAACIQCESCSTFGTTTACVGPSACSF